METRDAHRRRICLWGDPNGRVFIPDGRSVQYVARGTGANRKDLVKARPIERKLCIRGGLRDLASSGGSLMQPNPNYPQRSWGSDAKRPQGLSFAVPHEKLLKQAFREQYGIFHT